MPLCLDIHGVRIAFEAEDPRLARTVHEAGAYFGLAVAGEGEDAREAVFEVRVGPAPPTSAIARPYGEHLQVGVEGERVGLWSEHAAATVHPERGRAEAVVDVERAGTEEVVALFVLGVFLLLRPHGFFPLHAAALVRDGAGVLFAAPSDAGKSTLSYTLVRQGWGFLSDDSVLLHPTVDTVEALAFRQNFGLDPDAQARFPELAAHWGAQLADVEKGSIAVAELYPEQVRPRCTPRLLVFPEIEDRPTSALAPVSKADAFLLLAAQSALVTLAPRWTPAHLDVLRRLVNQAPAFRLRAGRDLLHHPTRIVELLEQTPPFASAHAAPYG